MNISPRRALVVAAAVLLAGCGASGEDSAGGSHGGGDAAAGGHGGHGGDEAIESPVAGAPAVTVTAVDLDFEPAQLALQAGEPTNVTVVNDGETLHDFTLDEAGVHANVAVGEEVTTAVTVDEPGSYKAICTVPGHEEAGMVVDVTVTE